MNRGKSASPHDETSSDSLRLLDDLGFGKISSAVAEECALQRDEPADIDAACDVIRPFGIAVTLPLLATLAEVATSDVGISEEALDLLQEIATRLSDDPVWIRFAA